MDVPRIIPLLREWQLLPGSYDLPQCACIGYKGEGALGVAKYLAESMDELVLSVELREVHEGAPDSNSSLPELAVLLSLEPEGVPALEGLPNHDEAYELSVAPSGVTVRAAAPHGLFNGAVSLLQLLPPCAPMAGDIRLDCLQVVDSPRFDWRGVMLDVGRHFFPVPFIYKILDMCALYKINKFHWHLTEDQGWRLEIKAYPRLTKFGSWRGKEEAQMHGGFYSQSQVREVVEYAAQRFITVVPEIELPGHCGAALACYPHLSCRGDVTEVPTQWGVHEDVFCAGNEGTFTFLKTVLKEVLDLFPSKYIHIGGDECPKMRWRQCEACQARLREAGLEDEFELQSWFVGRINAFLRGQGRVLIGWDEILEGGLSPGAMVMSWRGISGGVKAAKAGHDVIMTPTSHCYFDYRQSLKYDEPGAWYAMLPLEMVYSFDPVPPPPLEHAHQQQHQQELQQQEELLPAYECGYEEEEAAEDGGALEEEGAAPEQASTSGRASMEDGQASTRAEACNGKEDSGFVGPPRPPEEGASREDPGAEAAVSMESAELQPMSLSGPASPRPADEDDEDDEFEEERCEEGRSQDAQSEKHASQTNAGDVGSAVMEENGDAPPPEEVPVLMALPVRPQCMWTLEPEHAANIRGGQANLWTEYISDEATVEYMLLPRLAAMAEVLWSPLAARDWASFLARLKAQLPHLDARGLNYRQLE